MTHPPACVPPAKMPAPQFSCSANSPSLTRVSPHIPAFPSSPAPLTSQIPLTRLPSRKLNSPFSPTLLSNPSLQPSSATLLCNSPLQLCGLCTLCVKFLPLFHFH